MQWLQPNGAWALLALIPVLLLWVLKKKARQEMVPSLLLWKRMESEAPQSKPFQRLRSRWLLWLQMLTVLLLTAALMRPASLGGSQGESVFVFDLSLSMQAQSADGVTRLEEAQQQALRLLDGMADGEAVTLLTAGSSFCQALSRSKDHAQVRRAIEALKTENGGSDMAGALALAQAMVRDLEGLRIYVFSDDPQLEVGGATLCAVGKSAENRSLLDATMQPESGTAFARVQNNGNACDVTLECYADGVLCDVRTLSLPANGESGARFAIPENAETVLIRLTDSDALEADNLRYAVMPVNPNRRALLVTAGNVFVEQALALGGSLTVDKALPQDVIVAAEYDLYVYDGALPEPLPESGAILALNPDGPVLDIAPGESKAVSAALRPAAGDTARTLCENLLLSGIAIRQAKPLTGGVAVLEAGGSTLLSVQETDACRAAVLGFDVHDSNLPLKADFPVLMQNLLNYLLPDPAARLENTVCGQSMAISADVRSTQTLVLTPSGQQAALTAGRLENTREIGVYTLLERFDDGLERQTRFTVHPPAAESDTLHVARGQQGAQSAAGQGYREWTLPLLLLLFALVLLEWEVSRRGA